MGKNHIFHDKISTENLRKIKIIDFLGKLRQKNGLFWETKDQFIANKCISKVRNYFHQKCSVFKVKFISSYFILLLFFN